MLAESSQNIRLNDITAKEIDGVIVIAVANRGEQGASGNSFVSVVTATPEQPREEYPWLNVSRD